jgi:hypothetical protein
MEADPRVILLFVREARDLNLFGKCRDSGANLANTTEFFFCYVPGNGSCPGGCRPDMR